MVDNNPIEKIYDKFCSRNKGQKVIIKDSWKNQYGNYCNEIIYSIINPQDKIKDRYN